MPPLLHVENLCVRFQSDGAGEPLTVVRDACFGVDYGGFAALVGESGCGKSISALSMTRLPPTDNAQISGSVIFEGENLAALPLAALKRKRGRGIAYVFQDPASALNPVLRIEEQLREALPPEMPAAQRRPELLNLLETVRLENPSAILRAYPHELSGGMQQRVMVAMAVAARPKLLVADEPTTALDVTTQQQVLELLDSLRRERRMALLLITHNLGLVARYAAQVHVMYAGETIESGPVEAVLSTPCHHYTAGLLNAVPRLDMRSIEDLRGIPGRVPHPTAWPPGCAFAPRCPCATDDCRNGSVALRAVDTQATQGRMHRCLHPLTGKC